MSELCKLVSDDHLVKAQQVATDALEQYSDSPTLLSKLAEIESKQGHYSAAVKHLAAATKLDPSNHAITFEYALCLSRAGRESSALSFISSLPDDLRYRPSTRAILGDIYRSIGWHAHAIDAYGTLRELGWRARHNWLSSWWHCGGPLPIRHSSMWVLESNIYDLWTQKCSERHTMLEVIGLFNQPDQADRRAKLDTSLLWLMSAEIQSGEVERARTLLRGRLGQFGLAWLVAAIIINGVGAGRLPLPIVAVTSFVLAELTSLAMIYLIGIARFVIKRGRRGQLGWATWLLVGYIGLSMIQIFGAITLAGLLGLLLIDIGIVTAVWLNPFYACLREIVRCRQRYLQDFILGNFLDLLIDMNDPHKIHEVLERKKWIAVLEDTAFAIERFLGRYINARDAAIREWISTCACKSASIVRLMACRVALPSQAKMEQLIEDLQQSVAAIASDDFNALPKPNRQHIKQRTSRRQRLMPNLVQVTVALALLVTPFVVLAAVKEKNMVQLMITAAITASVPILIGMLLGPLRRATEGHRGSLDNQ